MNSEKEKYIREELHIKENRIAFWENRIDIGLPFQIRALREQREWGQERLAKEAGMKQEAISRSENPNYRGLSLNTLRKLAKAFDVGLLVRFVPVSELVEREFNPALEDLRVLSFPDEPYFHKESPKKFEEELRKLFEEHQEKEGLKQRVNWYEKTTEDGVFKTEEQNVIAGDSPFPLGGNR